ncbi:MAG: hypothetical protein GY799_21685 [Desulfobulbaceae bacterium]|nr:hypothetical protein [Desulfobulbaceae bacterium]
MSNFVILIGGPGLFKGCDKEHDQTWLNYIVPLQLAAQRNLYKLDTKELVHWVVYEPPYAARWRDDSTITQTEKRQDDGYNLHSIRKQAANKILTKGGQNYLGRIRQMAITLGIVYKGIKTPREFWLYLSSLPDDSVSRVWYSGHASGSELMLALAHNSACHAGALPKDTISMSAINKNKSLGKKFSKVSKKLSKFYGCYTSNFAESWHQVFSVPTAGAKMKIDFGVINRPSNIENVMKRIENTPTSRGLPYWEEFK